MIKQINFHSAIFGTIILKLKVGNYSLEFANYCIWKKNLNNIVYSIMVNLNIILPYAE